MVDSSSISKSPLESKWCNYGTRSSMASRDCEFAGLLPCTSLRECVSQYFSPQDLSEVECITCTATNQMDQCRLIMKSTSRDAPDLLSKISDFEIGMTSSSVIERMLSIENVPNVKTPAVKRLRLSRLPPLLCLHLCRRQYIEGRMRKIKHHISFPLCLSSNDLGYSGPEMEYGLRAVIVHHGGPESGQSCYLHLSICYHMYFLLLGHYTTYALTSVISEEGETQSFQEQWIHFSDQDVQAVSEQQVLSSEAYILLYDSSSSSSSDRYSDTAAPASGGGLSEVKDL